PGEVLHIGAHRPVGVQPVPDQPENTGRHFRMAHDVVRGPDELLDRELRDPGEDRIPAANTALPVRGREEELIGSDFLLYTIEDVHSLETRRPSTGLRGAAVRIRPFSEDGCATRSHKDGGSIKYTAHMPYGDTCDA